MQHQDSPGTGTDAVTSGNITTTQNGDYIYGVATDDGGNGTTFTPGTSFTGRIRLAGAFQTEDKTQSSAGSVAATFTSNLGFDHPTTGIMAFKPSAQTGQTIMASSTPSIATSRVKYRLSVPTSQAAGTYTNIVDYILIGTY